MIKASIELIYNTFGLTLWVTIPILIFFFIAIGWLCIISLILFLDLLYRPNSSQYPFNFILDKILPMIALLTPTLLIVTLRQDVATWLDKFGYIICIHLFLLIPLMYFWANHRNWSHHDNVVQKQSWNNPLVFFDIAVALIYPAIWGIYFTCLRYIHLGKEINLIHLITPNNLTYAIVIISLWPYTSIWLRFILKGLLDIRAYFWNIFCKLVLSIIAILLKYKTIFHLFSFIHKISFLWISFIIHYSPPYVKRKNIVNKCIHYIWLHPFLIYGLVLFIFLAELIVTRGVLYYSLYIFLIFLLLKAILYFLNLLGCNGVLWINFCCQANYTHLRWEDPYYPEMFWLSFNDFRELFEGYPPISDKLNEHIQKNIIKLWEKRRELLRKKRFYIYINISKRRTTFYHRFRIAYQDWTGLI